MASILRANRRFAIFDRPRPDDPLAIDEVVRFVCAESVNAMPALGRMSIAMVVRPLREHPEFASEFAHRFEQEWPGWYGPGGQGSALHDLQTFANPEGRLPLGVVAICEDNKACGLAALKANSIPEYNHLTPWAAAGYVLPELRGKGVGAALLSALVAEAGALGYNTVYCATATATTLLHRLGWHLLAQTLHDGKPIFLFASKRAP